MPVVPNPPEWPILAGKNTKQCEDELEYLTGLEGPMRQQPMITRGDPEDLKRARNQADSNGNAAPADEKNQSAAQVHQDKWREESNVLGRQSTHHLRGPRVGPHLELVSQQV